MASFHCTFYGDLIVKESSRYIEKCIAEGESLTQDFKFAINDSRKIAKSLVAFSNTIGGRLLIGVKDNGRIAGVQTDEEFHMVQAAAEIYCKPVIRFSTKTWLIDGKKILEILIPESRIKPHMALMENKKWRAFVRVGDENIVANLVQMKVWQKQKQNQGIKIEDTPHTKKLLTYLNDHDSVSLTEFYKLAGISYHKAVKLLSDLIILQIISISYNENGFIYCLNRNVVPFVTE